MPLHDLVDFEFLFGGRQPGSGVLVLINVLIECGGKFLFQLVFRQVELAEQIAIHHSAKMSLPTIPADGTNKRDDFPPHHVPVTRLLT